MSYLHDDFSALTPPDQAALSYADGVRYVVNFTTKTIEVILPDASRVEFAATDEVATPTPATWASYVKYDALGRPTHTIDVFVPSVAGVPLTYTRLMVFGFRNYDGTTSMITTYGGWDGFIGPATENGDLPTTGSATYRAEIIAGNATRYTGTLDMGLQANSTVNFSANFAAGTVATSLHLIGDSSFGNDDLGTFSGSGTIASGGPGFFGTLTGPASATGAFSGAFYGPRGEEMGYSFFVENAALNAGGTVAGRKN